MKLSNCIFAVALVAGALLAQLAIAQPAGGKRVSPAANADKNELALLQQSAKAFAEAFNRGDAKAVAALWTRNGEYLDAFGKRFAGQAEIEKEYARFFAKNPGAKIAIKIDSLRQVGDTSAIEDGQAAVQLGADKPETRSRYTAVHTKVNGRWYMASVRDEPIGLSVTDATPLRDLQWLVGTWRAEQNGGAMDVQVRWVADKKYLERTYTVVRDGKPVASGVQIIGWNFPAGRIQSWTFSSDGGHAVGSWLPRENGWAVETQGMLADGTPTSAVNLITRVDDASLTWQSVGRGVAGQGLPDAEKVLLKRVAPKRQ